MTPDETPSDRSSPRADQSLDDHVEPPDNTSVTSGMSKSSKSRSTLFEEADRNAAHSPEANEVNRSTNNTTQFERVDVNPPSSLEQNIEASTVENPTRDRVAGIASAQPRDGSSEHQPANIGGSNITPKALKSLDRSGELRGELLEQARTKYKRYRKYARGWGFAYYLFLFTAAAASTLAALVLKLDFFKSSEYRTDLAAVLALGAAFLVTVALGGFDRRRRVNRASEMSSELLELDILNPELKAEEIRKRLSKVVQRSHEGIVDQE